MTQAACAWDLGVESVMCQHVPGHVAGPLKTQLYLDLVVYTETWKHHVPEANERSHMTKRVPHTQKLDVGYSPPGGRIAHIQTPARLCSWNAFPL